VSAAYISLTYSILGQLANISVFESHHQSIFIHFHIVTFESEAEYLAELAQKTDFNEKKQHLKVIQGHQFYSHWKAYEALCNNVGFSFTGPKDMASEITKNRIRPPHFRLMPLQGTPQWYAKTFYCLKAEKFLAYIFAADSMGLSIFFSHFRGKIQKTHNLRSSVDSVHGAWSFKVIQRENATSYVISRLVTTVTLATLPYLAPFEMRRLKTPISFYLSFDALNRGVP